MVVTLLPIRNIEPDPGIKISYLIVTKRVKTLTDPTEIFMLGVVLPLNQTMSRGLLRLGI